MSNAKKFPTCDGNKISAMKTDSFCPKKALIATGPVNAILGDNALPGRARPATRSSTCGTVARASCGSSSPPAASTSAPGCTPVNRRVPRIVKQQGKNQITDVPLPPFVSTKVADVPNFYGSLIKEVLTFKKGFNSSGGLQGRQAPVQRRLHGGWSVGKETKMVKGSSKCS